MAKKLRLEYSGAIYHVLNRGDRREDIFHDDSDRELFLRTLTEACEKADWKVQAYCLMRDHFHLPALRTFVVRPQGRSGQRGDAKVRARLRFARSG